MNRQSQRNHGRGGKPRLIPFLVMLTLVWALPAYPAPAAKTGVAPVEGGIPIPPAMRAHPSKFFPIHDKDDSLTILKHHGFYIFDDLDHHHKRVREETGMHPKYTKPEINIPRRCFWVAYHFWRNRHALQAFLPPKLMRSLFDMEVVAKDDEMGGILVLMDLKTGKFYLGFGIFTLRKGFKTDNQLAERRVFRDYVAVKEITPAQVKVLGEAAQWVFPRKSRLKQIYWNPIGKKLLDKRNGKL